jgi:capsular polysaccharide biosynthesis protein
LFETRPQGLEEPGPARELIRRAQGEHWSEVHPHLVAMEVVCTALQGRTDARVLVVGGPDVTPWSRILVAQWPGLQVSTVRLPDDASATHARLAAEGPFHLVVDASDEDGNEQALLFQRTFMHLRQGGEYVARRLVPHPLPEDLPKNLPKESPKDPPGDALGDLHEDAATATATAPSAEALARQQAAALTAGDGATRIAVDDALPNENLPPDPAYAGDLWGLLTPAQEARTRDFRDVRAGTAAYRDVEGLGRSLEQVHVHSKVLRVVNGMRVAPKLREEEVDAVLAARPELGERLEALPAVTWTATCAYEANRVADPYVQSRLTVPEMVLRRYDTPTCSRGQIVTRDDILFPETFRQSWMERMANIYVVERAPRFGTVRRDISAPEALPGAWFHLDSEWPGHFGHLVTEQLSRMWAWDRVRQMEPDVRVLLTLQHDREPAVLAPFETAVLGAFGITPDDVHVFTAPCRPERLYTATGMFSLPRFAHPAMTRIWDRVGDHVVREAPKRRRPRRLFVSRRPSLKRSCHNVAEVEELFRHRGFEVVHPEEHPLAEQVALFRAAETIAGFAGSGLFSLAFCRRPKQVVVLGPDAYTARNEYLICALRGHDLTAVRSRSDLEHPRGSWTQQAFASGFTFDLNEEGRFLAERLDRLDARSPWLRRRG